MPYIEDYIQRQSKDNYARIANRKLIYLDLKFWILLRDGGKSDAELQLIFRLNELFNQRKCLFAASEATIWEVMKQHDPKSRGATLMLVEKYTEGVALLGDKQRAKIEFINWVRSQRGKQERYFPQEFVWANIHLMFGYFFYSEKSELLPLELQKSLLDFVSGMPLSALLSDRQVPPFGYKDDIVSMNENKEKFLEENKSYKALFLSELWGCLDCYKHIFSAAMTNLYFDETGRHPTDEERRRNDGEEWSKLIYQGFKKNTFTTELAIFNISAWLFAAMRWNKSRKYRDGNDTIDIVHAAAALPYCDYFFTERELHTIIGQLNFDKMYGCTVGSRPSEILSLLDAC